MSTINQSNEGKSGIGLGGWILRVVGITTLLVLTVFLVLTVLVLASTPLSGTLGSFYNWLVAANTTQRFWYVTRAAGITGYLLLWLSTVWGLAVPSKILQGRLHGTYTFDFHEFISLLAIGFIFLHVGVLMLDSYLPFSIAQIVVPFIAPYRPLWVGVGVLSLYIILLVTITFYIRDRIGAKAFRTIHVLSLLAFIGSAVHGLYSGTDSPLLVVKAMYALTFLSVVFLTTYWLATLALRSKTPLGAERRARPGAALPPQNAGRSLPPQSQQRQNQPASGPRNQADARPPSPTSRSIRDPMRKVGPASSSDRR